MLDQTLNVLDQTLLIAVMVALLVVNALGVLLVALQLPGTWLIVLATSLVAWWRWEEGTIGWWALGLLLGLAVLGEVVEFVAGAAGATQAGASKRGAAIAILGGVVGAVAGTPLIPIPVIGTLIGAAVGAGAGSILGDLWAGREWGPALHGGRGAAIGKFWGAVGKLAIAAVMWVVVLVAVLWP